MLKLKRTPGIYLVGFMGCGKSTLGRLLAERLGWSFVDLDDDIETREGTTIAALFESEGEQTFRRIESDAIRARVRSIECGIPMVVALGGGAFVQEVNYELLENNGVTIWIDCPFDVIQRRVEKECHRPLARDPEKFAQLYESRRGAYSRADFHITVGDEDPESAVESVLKLPVFR